MGKATAVKTENADALEAKKNAKAPVSAKKGTAHKRDKPAPKPKVHSLVQARPTVPRKRKHVAIDAKAKVSCPTCSYVITLGPKKDGTTNDKADCPHCGDTLTLKDNAVGVKKEGKEVSIEELRKPKAPTEDFVDEDELDEVG